MCPVVPEVPSHQYWTGGLALERSAVQILGVKGSCLPQLPQACTRPVATLSSKGKAGSQSHALGSLMTISELLGSGIWQSHSIRPLWSTTVILLELENMQNKASCRGTQLLDSWLSQGHISALLHTPQFCWAVPKSILLCVLAWVAMMPGSLQPADRAVLLCNNSDLTQSWRISSDTQSSCQPAHQFSTTCQRTAG